jgi:Flp pilus assembly protein TadB
MPPPPGIDDAALLATLTAAAARGGAEVTETLRVARDTAPAEIAEGLRRVERLLQLGLHVPEALARSEVEALREMGAELGRCLVAGAPAAETLERFARRRIATSALEFEERMRKSAVVMVLPLSLCLLPAYVLLVLVPFLRSLSP